MWSQLPPHLSCLQNNLLENNVEPVPSKSDIGTVLVFLPVFSNVTIFQHKTIQCSWVWPYFIFWKMKIMSYVFWQISSSIKLQLGKITKGKKGLCQFFGKCSRMSPYFIFWKMKIMRYVFRHVPLLMKLWPEKITTGKKKYYVSLFGSVGK